MNIVPSDSHVAASLMALSANPNYRDALQDLESSVQTGSSIEKACQVFARTVVDASGEDPDVERLRGNFEAAKLHLQREGVFEGAVPSQFSRAFVEAATEKVVKFVAKNPAFPASALWGLNDRQSRQYSMKKLNEIMDLALPIQEIAFKNMREVGLLQEITKRAIVNNFHAPFPLGSKMYIEDISSCLEERQYKYLAAQGHLDTLQAVNFGLDLPDPRKAVVEKAVAEGLDMRIQGLVDSGRIDEAVEMLDRLSNVPFSSQVRKDIYFGFCHLIVMSFPLAEVSAIANKIAHPIRRQNLIDHAYYYRSCNLLFAGLVDDALEMAQKISNITTRQEKLRDLLDDPTEGTPTEISMSQRFNYRLDTTKPTFGG